METLIILRQMRRWLCERIARGKERANASGNGLAWSVKKEVYVEVLRYIDELIGDEVRT